MSETVKKVELLSPAGEWESLNSCLNFGADAVYLAGKGFGMRTASKNFDEISLKKAVELVHSLNKKLYVTCNTVPLNSEIEEIPAFLEFLNEIKVDAVITADLGVLRLAKKYCKDIDIHISTQAGIVNYEAARMFYELGAKRVVLARELSFDDIAKIRANIPNDLEIECFIHGAMCVSFSGRCLISHYMTGRDANRGDCAQPCRWKYHLFEENREGQFFPVEENSEGTFLYNSRDMCMIDYIPRLIEVGIDSLKIEGRAKSSYYAGVVTNAYRHAIDDYYKMGKQYSLAPWIKEELEKVSHREYSNGFFLGNEPGQVLSNGGYIRKYNVVAISEGCKNGILHLSQRNKFLKGDTLDVLPPNGIPFEITLEKLYNDKNEEIESAPHAMMDVFAPCNADVPKGSYIRKKL